MSIRAENVTKYYGEQKALDSVSFTIPTGQIAGFLGPNGAGKSTMMKILTGFIPASSGTVFINDIESAADSISVRKIIGYLPENNPLYPEMYIREYLLFVASFYKDIKNVRKAVDDVIAVTGLTPEKDKKIGSLSKGYRQRVGLAQALIHSPEVLVLDEATTGLDPNQIVEIRNLIREAGKEKTILLSTHIMQEVEAICDRIIIIDKGVIVADADKSVIYSKIRKTKQVVVAEFDKNPGEASIRTITGVVSARNSQGNTWILESDMDEDLRAKVFEYAVSSRLTVLSLQKQESNLEEVFRLLTS